MSREHRVVLLRSSRHLGGIERQLLDHARRLRTEGWRPYIVCLHRRPSPHPLTIAARAQGVSASTIFDPSPHSLAPWRALSKALSAIQPQIIHTCDYRTDVMAAWLGRGRVWLAESHGHTGGGWPMSLWNWLDVRALRRARCIMAVSLAWETALAAYGISATRLRTVGNATAALWPDPSPPPKQPSSPGPFILYAGRLSPEKGVDLLLTAWPDIRRKHPQAELWVLGSIERGSSYAARLEPGLHQKGVHFFGYHEDIRPWLLAADAVVAPSRREAWGLTAFEALCAGKPLVATRVGGLPELCRGAPHAHLVTPENSDALVEGVSIALAPDFPRGQAVARAYRTQTRFDPQRRFEKVLACYRLALSFEPIARRDENMIS
ncbi:MAG: glycosyltransferase family 4 protein [Chloroflexi bacterium]|nr:glycosyltransferase family 4 protein [Chloroflexota bacterium]